MKSTEHAKEWSTAKKLSYVRGKLSLIPAFGDSIGKDVNKAELALCVAMLASAEASHADLLAALEALSFESSHFLSGEGNNGQFVENALENAFAAITRAKGVQS